MLRSHCFTRVGVDGEPLPPASGGAPPPANLATCADITPFPNPQLGVKSASPISGRSGSRWWAPTFTAPPSGPPRSRTRTTSAWTPRSPHPPATCWCAARRSSSSPRCRSRTRRSSSCRSAPVSFGASPGRIQNVAEAVSRRAAPMRQRLSSAGNPSRTTSARRFAESDGGTCSFPASCSARCGTAAPARRRRLVPFGQDQGAERSARRRPYYVANGTVNSSPTVTEVDDAGRFELANPMEARVGVRYHHPRQGRNRRTGSPNTTAGRATRWPRICSTWSST